MKRKTSLTAAILATGATLLGMAAFTIAVWTLPDEISDKDVVRLLIYAAQSAFMGSLAVSYWRGRRNRT